MVKVLCYGHKVTSSSLVRVYLDSYYNSELTIFVFI